MKSDSKKRIRKRESQLRTAPKIEPNSYYISDVHRNLKPIDVLSVKHKGLTLKTLLEQKFDLDRHHRELKEYVLQCEVALTGILIANGYQTPNVDLDLLVEDVTKLNIIKPGIEYVGYQFNDSGYVIGYGYDVILEKKEEPDDFNKGYWKVDDKGVWTLDSERMSALWNG